MPKGERPGEYKQHGYVTGKEEIDAAPKMYRKRWVDYFLIIHDHPPIIIHEEDRKKYYTALEAWDTRQDLEPLRNFLREHTEKTWAKQLARAEKHHH